MLFFFLLGLAQEKNYYSTPTKLALLLPHDQKDVGLILTATNFLAKTCHSKLLGVSRLRE